MRQAWHEATAHWIADLREHDRYGLRCLFQRHQASRGAGDDDVRLQANQFDCGSAQALGLAVAPANIEPSIAVVPAELLKSLLEGRKITLSQRVTFSHCHQHADASHLAGLLRACRERPRNRATEECDELAAPHSITSSARNRNDWGIWLELRGLGNKLAELIRRVTAHSRGPRIA